jgi:IclR family transcriptional regulator, acetate operon repressor
VTAPRSTGPGPGVQALARGVDLLEALADAGGEAGVSELAERTGLAPGTIHRLVRTLLHAGYLRQLPSRRYALGPRLVRLGDAAGRLLGRWATPALTELVAAVGETANLAALDGDHAVYVAQVPSPHSVRVFAEIGRRVPLHSTAVGKALLSTLPAAAVDAVLARTGLPAATAATITDPDRLRAELAAVREHGHARDEGEQELGVRCVAVPVVGPHGPVALSVSGPDTRMDQPALRRIVPIVVAAADRLRAALAA